MGFIWNFIRSLTMSQEDYVSARLQENLKHKYENDSEFRESTDRLFGDRYGKVKYNDSGEVMCEYGQFSELGTWGNCKGLGTIEAYAPVGEPIIVCSNCYPHVSGVTEIWEKAYSNREINPEGPPQRKY